MGVYILQNDRLVYVNPKAADMLGYTQQELIDAAVAVSRSCTSRIARCVIDQLARLDPERVPSVQLAMRGVRKDGEVIQVEAFCSRHRVRQPARDPRDRARHQRSREARGSAAPGAEDGSGRPPGRRHRARLQQPADGDSRQRRADVASRQARSGDGRGGRRDPARRRSRRLADPPAAGVQPQAGAAAGRARHQRDRRRRVAHGAPPDRHRRAAAPRARRRRCRRCSPIRRRSSRCCST